MVFQPAITFIQCATCVCAAQVMIFFRCGACALANAWLPAKPTALAFRQSSMKPMLATRMVFTTGRHSAGISAASSVSSADCMRLR